jgi:hypothetical protein
MGDHLIVMGIVVVIMEVHTQGHSRMVIEQIVSGEIELCLRVGSLVHVPVIVLDLLLRVTVLQSWCQRHRLLSWIRMLV